MTSVTRMIAILTLMLSIAVSLPAQQTTTAAATTTATSTAPATTGTVPFGEPSSSHETRNSFSNLLRNHPSELATILVLDPTLLSNEPFLSGYPELERFVAAHPEVRRNPRFYLGGFRATGEGRPVFEEIVEMLSIAMVGGLMAFAFFWFVRTIVDQRRWSRISKTQTEVHNKILDRFGTSEELLQYMKTPAGSKFLESAPIPLHTEPAPQNPPLTRAMWSIQIGVVVAAAALGMLLVSSKFEKETAQGLFAMGVIAFSTGVGFIISAAVALFLSRRFGLWQSSADRINDPGLIR